MMKLFNSLTNNVRFTYLSGKNTINIPIDYSAEKIKSNQKLSYAKTLIFNIPAYALSYDEGKATWQNQFLGTILKGNVDMSKIQIEGTHKSYFITDCNDLVSVKNFYSSQGPESLFYHCPKLKYFHCLKADRSIADFLNNCPELEEVIIESADVSTDYSSNFTLSNSPKLKKLIWKGLHHSNNTGSLSINLSGCTLLTEEALVEFFNSLGTNKYAATITLGSTLLSKLTDEDKAIATNKGWTLA